MELDVKADATDLFNVRGEKTYGPSSNYYARLQNLYVDSNVLVDGDVTVNGTFSASDGQIDAEDIFAQTVTVSSTLTIGSNGKIDAGPTVVDSDGIHIVGASSYNANRAYVLKDDTEDTKARIWLQTGSPDLFKIEAEPITGTDIRLRSDNILELGANFEQEIRFQTDAAVNPATYWRMNLDRETLDFVEERTSKIQKSDLSGGEAVIYKYDNNGDIELRAAQLNVSDGTFNETKIVG